MGLVRRTKVPKEDLRGNLREDLQGKWGSVRQTTITAEIPHPTSASTSQRSQWVVDEKTSYLGRRNACSWIGIQKSPGLSAKLARLRPGKTASIRK